MLEKLDGSEGSVLGYRLSGVIDKADYAAMVPEMESLVAQYGTVQLLCDLTDLRWEKASAWGSDLHFGKEFHDAITRMAIVGDGALQKILADLAKPFYAKEVRYFADQQAAWEWLRG